MAEGKALKACWNAPDTAGNQTRVLWGKLETHTHIHTQTSMPGLSSRVQRLTEEDKANRLIPLVEETVAAFGGVETFVFTAGNLQQQKCQC